MIKGKSKLTKDSRRAFVRSNHCVEMPEQPCQGGEVVLYMKIISLSAIYIQKLKIQPVLI